MYSQTEIDEAVSAGAISADAANALRAYIEGERHLPTPDEEQFRLITGFNDIFVSIAAAILIFAVGWIGQWVGQATGTAIERDGPSFLAPAAVAATSWALALFFTAKRRIALPSILLLLTFVGVGLVSTVSSILLTIKRLHDMNLPVPLIICLFIPAISIFALIAFLVWPGTDGANGYGRVPNRPKD